MPKQYPKSDVVQLGNLIVGQLCGGGHGSVFQKPRVDLKGGFVGLDGIGLGFWWKADPKFFFRVGHPYGHDTVPLATHLSWSSAARRVLGWISEAFEPNWFEVEEKALLKADKVYMRRRARAIKKGSPEDNWAKGVDHLRDYEYSDSF